MSCCGSNRAAWRKSPAAPSAPSAKRPSAPPAVPSGGPRTTTVLLRWRRAVSATVIGPVTGTRYAVSAATPSVAVEPRDAAGLLATGFFARMG